MSMAQGLYTRTVLPWFGLHYLPPDCALLEHFPLLTQLLSAHRLAHPEGSLPDLAVMNMTTSLDKPEVQKLVEAGEERPEECAKKAEKGQPGKDSDESEEEEDEEEESEEEETSGNQPLSSAAVTAQMTVTFSKDLPVILSNKS